MITAAARPGPSGAEAASSDHLLPQPAVGDDSIPDGAVLAVARKLTWVGARER